MAETLMWVNGKQVDPGAPHISGLDRGFNRADGLFETMRSYDGHVAFLKRHMQRLAGGAKALGLILPDLSEQVLTGARVARENGWGDAAVRLTVSRGVGDLGLPPTPGVEPTAVVIASPLPPMPPGLYDRGISVQIAKGRRNEYSVTSGLKTLAYAEAVIALTAALEAGFDDALFLDIEGHVAEGPISNVMFVRGRKVITPPLTCGILPGITRAITMELGAEQGLTVEERPVERDEIAAADEMFYTSSLRELYPIVKVDDTTIGDGRPGPVYRQLHQAYAAGVRARS
ncbi:MAG: aminotransferase class IV [Gemmatimonadaceae bacterium]